MSFKIGDKVVCIHPNAKGEWIGWKTTVRGPKTNDIDVVSGFDVDGYLLLEKYSQSDGFMPKHFRKIDNNFGSDVADKIETEINEKIKELTGAMDFLNLTRR